MLEQFTQSGQLPVGVTVEGVVHRDFEIRPPTVADVMASDVFPTATGKKAAVLKRVLTHLGDLKGPQITDAIMQGMGLIDFETLLEASDALDEKMRSFRNPPQEGGSASGTPHGVE